MNPIREAAEEIAKHYESIIDGNESTVYGNYHYIDIIEQIIRTKIEAVVPKKELDIAESDLTYGIIVGHNKCRAAILGEKSNEKHRQK